MIELGQPHIEYVYAGVGINPSILHEIRFTCGCHREDRAYPVAEIVRAEQEADAWLERHQACARQVGIA